MNDATYSAGPWYRRATLEVLSRETVGLIESETPGSDGVSEVVTDQFSKLGEGNED
jgi:hypothetical protein